MDGKRWRETSVVKLWEGYGRDEERESEGKKMQVCGRSEETTV